MSRSEARSAGIACLAALGVAVSIGLHAAAAQGGAAGAPAERVVVSGKTLEVGRDPATRELRTVAAVDSDLLESVDVAALTSEGIGEIGTRLVTRYAGLLGVGPGQLVLAKAEKSGDAWYVGYRQAAGGIPVFGSSLGFSIDEAGRVRSMGAVLYPGAPAPPAAKIGREQALAAALARLREIDGDRHRLLAESAAILPERDGAAVSYRLVSIFNFFLEGNPRPARATNGYALFVDMATGDVVRTQPLVRPLGCCLPKDWMPPPDGGG